MRGRVHYTVFMAIYRGRRHDSTEARYDSGG